MRADHADRALRHLVQAAACMDFPTKENKAQAMLLAGMAIIEVARSDASGEAHDLALELVRTEKERRHHGDEAE